MPLTRATGGSGSSTINFRARQQRESEYPLSQTTSIRLAEFNTVDIHDDRLLRADVDYRLHGHGRSIHCHPLYLPVVRVGNGGSRRFIQVQAFLARGEYRYG
ncbi:hypothetical protein KCP74_25320 [Salmonella enterica subsp. enterica]|nr:hypothetical protein KCP74_25320 [Salmonella enterica subsp. enterica]